MFLKVKCSDVNCYSTIIKLCHKVKNYCVLIIIAALSFFNTSVIAELPGSYPGDPPTGYFYLTPVIPGSGGYYTGRNVYIELLAIPEDLDGYICPVPPIWHDEFSYDHAIKWVITNLTDENPLNLEGVYAHFTTKNDLSLGNPGSIAMKVRDDGVYYQDVKIQDDNVQVASYNIWIIDPTGIRILSQTAEPINWATDPITIETSIVWQLTYNDVDFPWVGTGIQEYLNSYGVEYQYGDQHQGIADPYAFYPDGDNNPVAGYHWSPYNNEMGNEGYFVDWHTAYFSKPLPSSYLYYVGYCSQRFMNYDLYGYVDGHFLDYEFIDNTPAFKHDEYYYDSN
jgi:hypothetical protein